MTFNWRARINKNDGAVEKGGDFVQDDAILSYTFKVDKSVEDEWKNYMSGNGKVEGGFIAGCLETNSKCFHNYNVRKQIDENNDKPSTYHVEFISRSTKKVNEFLENYEQRLFAEHDKRFEEKVQATREVMESQFNQWFERIPLDNIARNV